LEEQEQYNFSAKDKYSKPVHCKTYFESIQSHMLLDFCLFVVDVRNL